MSFFEKLTGSVTAEKQAVEVSHVEEVAADQQEYEVSTIASRGSAVAEKPKKDWTNLQAEGQLTVDIFDKGDKIVIMSAVAGTDPNDLDITLTHDMITIKGTRKHADEISEENYYYRELYWGAFSRTIILPEEVDDSKAEASIKNGILMVKLPKKQHGNSKIKVKVE
jgi:HSP20 family protein